MLNRFLGKRNMRMSISEYCQLQRGELTLNDIYNNRKLDDFAAKILNSKHRVAIVFIVASGLLVLNSTNTFAVTSIDTSKIDLLGSTVLGLIRTCGYWFCIILATKDIIGELMRGTTKQIGSIVVKYLTAFGAFYALPWIFDLIAELLG